MSRHGLSDVDWFSALSDLGGVVCDILLILFVLDWHVIYAVCLFRLPQWTTKAISVDRLMMNPNTLRIMTACQVIIAYQCLPSPNRLISATPPFQLTGFTNI